ncbi:MAG: YegS/Rv2252/BmrU family lipid kinase [Oscillospiraceae bacterium]|nr:YegS/Rv2252/BmrU family lipid kinase [Oscillospiraceae bacterium]
MAIPHFGADRRLMLVVNPAAGRRMAERNLAAVCRILLQQGWIVSTFVTGARGEAARLVQQHAAQYDRIVCMGGDGTLNETVTGLLQAGLDIPVGFIPCGSTNDFASVHGLSADMKTAAAAAAGDSISRIDVASFNESYFTFHAAFGWLANVVNTTPQDAKNLLGYVTYVLHGIADISSLKAVTARFTADGRQYEGDYIYGGVLSTLSLGGNIVSFPRDIVSTNDGMFEVFLIRMPKDLLELGELLHLLGTGVLQSRYTEFFRVSEMQVEAAENMNWSLDGEAYRGEGNGGSIKVLPRRIQLVGAVKQ